MAETKTSSSYTQFAGSECRNKLSGKESMLRVGEFFGLSHFVNSDPMDVISTQHFCSWTHCHWHHKSREFAFGESVLVPQSNLADVISKQFYQTDPISQRLRKIVLVGQSPYYHINAMRRYGVHLEQFDNIIGILDTAIIATAVFSRRPRTGYTLQAILRMLKCPYLTLRGAPILHNPGNNVNYVLRSLLLLVDKFCRNKLSGGQRGYHNFKKNFPELEKRLDDLRAIGLSPYPDIRERNATNDYFCQAAASEPRIKDLWDWEDLWDWDSSLEIPLAGLFEQTV